jgi:hypothetical protein
MDGKVLPLLVQFDYLSRLWTFRAIFDSEFHSLALFQVSESFPDDGRVMHKDILCTSIGLDKPVPLHAAEPLDRPYGSLRHFCAHLLPYSNSLNTGQRPEGGSVFKGQRITAFHKAQNRRGQHKKASAAPLQRYENR